MSFQVKDFVSIAASMINIMRATQRNATDFNEGSTARTLVEAPAVEIDELYQQAFIGLKEAIPVSVYNSFDFNALPAVPAGGVITVTIQSSPTLVVIPAGTVFTPSAGGVAYASLQDINIAPAVTSVPVAVSAISPGAIGNIASGGSFTLNPVPTGFISATNSAAFINGSDLESEEARKARFRDYIQSLSHGPLASIIFGLKTAFLLDSAGNQKERVVFASVIEPYKLDNMQPRALVHAYIHNGIGGTSNDLIAEAKRIVDGYYDANNNPVIGYAAAGVEVTVEAATEVEVDVTAEIEALEGFDVSMLAGQAESLVSAYILSLKSEDSAMLSEIYRIVKDMIGVKNVIISDPVADIPSAADEKLMPGTIAITPAV